MRKFTVMGIFFFLFFVFLAVPGKGATDERTIIKDAHVESELISSVEKLAPGAEFWLGLRLKMDPGWHTYWKNPGDSGLPIRVQWVERANLEIGPIQWPTPQKHRVAHLVNYGYEKQVVLPIHVRAPHSLRSGEAITLHAKLKYLACLEECIPGKADLRLRLLVGESTAPHSLWDPLFQHALKEIPRPLSAQEAQARWHGGMIEVEFKKKFTPGTSVEFFPAEPLVLDESKPMQISTRNGRSVVHLPVVTGFQSKTGRLEGVFTLQPGQDTRQGFEVNLAIKDVPAASTKSTSTARPSASTPSTASVQTTRYDLWVILLFAFLGGLILNLMPCVFPVLAIKILNFVQKSHEKKSTIRQLGLFYSAGVVLSFLTLAAVLLAFKAGGEKLGWGFQLQSPGFIAILIFIFFALGLNLAGRFEIGTRLMSLGSQTQVRSPSLESFLTGVLAVIVATPCSAPFMGAAIGFALTQSTAVTLLVFVFLGAGMAFPYLLLSLQPKWLSALPRPGAWMVTFKEFLSFLLFGSVIWMLWVFSFQTGPNGAALLLTGLLFFYMTIWLKEKSKGRVGKLFAAGSLVLAAVFTLSAVREKPLSPGLKGVESNSSSPVHWQVFSEEKLQELQKESRAIFVNFTAAWCLTCKINEKAVFSSDAVLETLKSKNVALLVADWTNHDEHIAEFLARFDRAGIPLYLLYPPGANEPIILPQILTPGKFIESVKEISP